MGNKVYRSLFVKTTLNSPGDSGVHIGYLIFDDQSVVLVISGRTNLCS